MAAPNTFKPYPVPTGIVQQFSTGGTADGTLPPNGTTVDTTTSRYREIYGAAATGGLFDFQNDTVITLIGFEAALGGQSAWSLFVTDGITDAAANDVLVASGTSEATVMLGESLTLFMLPGQKLRFKTTGTVSSGHTWYVCAKVVRTFTEAGLFIG